MHSVSCDAHGRGRTRQFQCNPTSIRAFENSLFYVQKEGPRLRTNNWCDWYSFGCNHTGIPQATTLNTSSSYGLKSQFVNQSDPVVGSQRTRREQGQYLENLIGETADVQDVGPFQCLRMGIGLDVDTR